LDGVNWNINIILDNKKIKCDGNNAYPGDKPGEISYIPSTTFVKFLHTLEDSYKKTGLIKFIISAIIPCT
jgi:hypothetical protein